MAFVVVAVVELGEVASHMAQDLDPPWVDAYLDVVDVAEVDGIPAGMVAGVGSLD